MGDMVAAGAGELGAWNGTLPPSSSPLEAPEVWHRFYHGYAGPNRNRDADSCALKTATDDYMAVQVWLQKVASRSAATRANYVKDVSRFMAWAAIERGKRLSDINESDLVAYQDFLKSPSPSDRWIGPTGRRRKDARGWVPPFSKGLSDASRVTTMATLQSLYTFLSDTGYHHVNPFKAISITALQKQADTVTRRNLSEVEWAWVQETIETLPRETESERRRYHRTRWLFALLYYTGIRRSEVANGHMSDFFMKSTGKLLVVHGKGAKDRSVVVPARLAQELEIYRRSLGKSPWPSKSDCSPLLERLEGVDRENASGHAVSPTLVGNTVKDIFVLAAERATASGDADLAESLQAMSAHWLRHTFGTELMRRTKAPQKVQRQMGHEDINTTLQYSHEDEDETIVAVERAYAGDVLPKEEDNQT